MMHFYFSFLKTPPRSALDAARWLAAFWPLTILLGGSAADATATLVAVLFVAHSVLNKDWGWLKVRWVQLALALWVYTLLRSLWADDMATAATRAATWLRFPLLAAALAHGAITHENSRVLWTSLTITVVALLVDGLLQYATGYDILGHPLFDNNGVYRLTGPFNSPKIGIIIVGLGFPVILALLGSKRWRWGAALAPVFLFVIFASGERMALLLCLLGFGLAFMLWRGALYWRLSAVAVLALVLVAGMLADASRMQRQYISTREAIANFGNTPYGMLWQSGWNIAKDHPAFGVGLKHFRTYCPDARYGTTDVELLRFRCNLHPHNIYIEWLAETGVVGFILFVSMLACIFAPLLRAVPHSRHDGLFLGLAITAILRFWPVSATTSFFAGWLAIPTWFMLGWALYMAQKQQPVQG